MNTAEVIDLSDYRARRSGPSPRPARLPAQGFALLTVPMFVGFFPFWIVMGVPVAAGSRDA